MTRASAPDGIFLVAATRLERGVRLTDALSAASRLAAAALLRWRAAYRAWASRLTVTEVVYAEMARACWSGANRSMPASSSAEFRPIGITWLRRERLRSGGALGCDCDLPAPLARCRRFIGAGGVVAAWPAVGRASRADRGGALCRDPIVALQAGSRSRGLLTIVAAQLTLLRLYWHESEHGLALAF